MSLKLALLSIIWLILSQSDFTEANSITKSWWNPIRSTIIDRSLAGQDTPGSYHILSVDRTAFSVNRPISLHQFDISKIFVENSTGKSVVDDVPVKIKIMEKYLDDMRDKAVVFVGMATLNSTNEARIQVSPEIQLTPKRMYEIRLAMPALNFLYDEPLGMQQHRIERLFWRTIVIDFYQNNVVDRPIDMAENSTHEVSRGMVKRLHVKYTKF